MDHPFHGPSARSLYRTEERTRRRSDALLSAKTAGRNISEVILELADQAGLRPNPRILDVGCGQGRTALRLARHFREGHVIAVDASSAMAQDAMKRAAGEPVTAIAADFHQLPFTSRSFDLVTAVMCLYHSPTPERAISEIARTTNTGGAAVLVTKAADSYNELAELLATTELDPHAMKRPSLYVKAHSGNLADLASSGGLHITGIDHEVHHFVFRDLEHVARYLTTCPQYQLSAGLDNADSLATALRARLPDRSVHTTATITYLTGRPQ